MLSEHGFKYSVLCHPSTHRERQLSCRILWTVHSRPSSRILNDTALHHGVCEIALLKQEKKAVKLAPDFPSEQAHEGSAVLFTARL